MTIATISLRGINIDDFDVSMLVSGTVTTADVGKAVSLDTATACTVKLAADGDAVIGELLTYENRVQEGIKIGTMSPKGSARFAYTATAPSIGGQIQGAGAGVVKVLSGSNARFPHFVTAVDTVAATVDVLFL